MNVNPLYPDLIVLGSTGSVGEQAMDVARAHSIPVRGVTAHRSVETVEAQIREFHPDFAVLTKGADYRSLGAEACRQAALSLAADALFSLGVPQRPLPGEYITPPFAMASRPSSRMLLSKYFAM